MDRAVLSDLLEELVNQHDQAGSPLRSSLRSGYTGDFQSAFMDMDLTVHPSVRELFRWHDGIDWDSWRGSGTPSLFPFYGEFSSFEDQATSQLVMLDSLEGDPESSFWRYSWFPVLDGDSVSLIVECDRASSTYGAIWLSYVDALRAEPVADSLHSLLETVTDLFQMGRFEYSIGGLSTNPEVGSDEVLSWLKGE